MCKQGNNMCCDSELNLDKLCVDCVSAGCIKVKQIVANDVCSQSIEVKDLFSENEVANNICVPGTIQAAQLSSLSSNTNSLCAQNANIGSACVNNLTVGNLNYCAKFRAAAAPAADFIYTLGTDMNFTTIIDDPSGNLSMSPLTYTVPVSGYYQVNIHLNTHGLSGSGVIGGAPVGDVELYVNGLLFMDNLVPYLAFSGIQTGQLGALVLLNAGDKLTLRYDVIVLDPVSGEMDYSGTVVIEGNGTYFNSSSFAIHYLSSLNCSTVTCPTCPTVDIACQPFITPCLPIGSGTQPNPCESCQ